MSTITVNRPNGGSSSLTVGGNEGPGMLAGLDMAFDVSSDDDPASGWDVYVIGVPN